MTDLFNSKREREGGRERLGFKPCDGARTAFTLAEVLITLAIIGVVAALTIPTVVKNYQKQQTVVKLKKIYNTLNQAAQMAMVDYGTVSGWGYCDTNGSGEEVDNFVNKYLVPYIKISKNCRRNTEGDCNFTYYYLNSDDNFTLSGNYTRFYTADGYFVACRNYKNTSDGLHQYIGCFINIEPKKPAKLGKNTFRLNLFVSEHGKPGNGIFVPNARTTSLESIKSECSKTTTSAGDTCLTLIMKQGWEITDDYPW